MRVATNPDPQHKLLCLLSKAVRCSVRSTMFITLHTPLTLRSEGARCFGRAVAINILLLREQRTAPQEQLLPEEGRRQERVARVCILNFCRPPSHIRQGLTGLFDKDAFVGQR